MWHWPRLTKKRAAAIKARRPFVPRLEHLESRLVLAGNVMAVLSGGNLTVTGDNNGAEVFVSQSASGKFTLWGNDLTKVNGSYNPVTFSKVTKDLRFNFGNGDDHLIFDNFDSIKVSGNVFINGGRGSNSVSSFGLNVGGNVSVLNLLGDTQFISFENLNAKGNVQIVNQGGDSWVNVNGGYADDGSPSPSTIRGNLVITNGSGNTNTNILQSIQVKGNVQITNNGKSSSSSIYAFAGRSAIGGDVQIVNSSTEFSDSEIVNVNIGRGLKVSTRGSSDSTILLTSSTIKGAANIQSANGDDKVLMKDMVFGGDFQLQTGKGDDNVYIGAEGEFEVVRYVPETREKTVELPGGEFVTITYTVYKPVYVTQFFEGGPVTFNGKVNATLDDGSDTLKLAVDAEVKFKKKATFDGQAGDNFKQVGAANLPTQPTLLQFQILPITIIVDDDEGSLVGDGHGSALAGFVDAAGRINLTVSGYPDYNFIGDHTVEGEYVLYIRLGESDFSNFDSGVFDFQFTDSVVPGNVDTFNLTGQTPGLHFIAWIDNAIGPVMPDTMMRFRAIV